MRVHLRSASKIHPIQRSACRLGCSLAERAGLMHHQYRNIHVAQHMTGDVAKHPFPEP